MMSVSQRPYPFKKTEEQGDFGHLTVLRHTDIDLAPKPASYSAKHLKDLNSKTSRGTEKA